MTIYIAMATICDNQTTYTAKEAIENADRPEDISIGIAFMTDEHYFEKISNELKSYPQIKTKRFNPDENVGVGIGRHNAYCFYNNEDYVLQIDSHTKFEKGWDSILVDTYKKALEETNNEKTILSSYLPRYVHKAGLERENIGPQKALYSFLSDKKRPERDIIFSCNNLSLLESIFDDSYPNKDANKKTFLPAQKVCGGFIFGKKEFVQDRGLPTNVLFWGEEIIQPINLIDMGFSIVFPNIKIPLRHLYANDIEEGPSDRVALILSWYGLEGKDDDMIYKDFMENEKNKEKIKKFIDYAKFHPLEGPIIKNHIPEYYTR